MDNSKYLSMVSDIRSQVNSGMLEACLRLKQATRRRGLLLSIVRDGFSRSSLSSYGGVLHWWDGRCYVSVSDDEFSNMVFDLMTGWSVSADDLLGIDLMVRQLRKAVLVKELVVDNGKVAFSNCVLDVGTGELLDFDKSIVVFSCLPYDYDKEAKCWRWLQFLDEVLPEEKHQRILQEFIGALFVDRHKAKVEQMLVLKGGGANGKSVVFEVVCGLLGEDNVSHFTLKSLLSSNYDRKRNIAQINGKRLNYASETDNFVIPKDNGMLKALISGEPLEARPLYGRNFVARDIPMLMMNANILPEIDDWSYGMRRRVTILPFTVEIPKWKQDVTLAGELRKELSGIMNWALAGRARFVRNQYKFTESAEVEKLLDEVQGETSNVHEYMRIYGYQRRDEAVKGSQPVWVSVNDLYSEYMKWCIACEDMAETKRRFMKILRDANWRNKRRSDCTYFGLYGEKAIRRQTQLLKADHAAKELNAQYKGERYFNYKAVRDRAEAVMQANGWTRCAVGWTDLQEYLGYTFDWRGHLNRGQLEGCFVVDDGIYYFDLNAIDSLWRPKYEAGIKDRIRRKEADREYKELKENL